MQQFEWSIPANTWAGLNTKYDPSTKLVGPDEFISGSANYDLSPTGNITKRDKTEVYNATPLANPIKDEYEMIFESGLRHKLVMSNGSLYYTTGNGVFNLVQAGYVAAGNMEFASMNNRVYFGNGIDDPQVYDIGTTYGGVPYTPPSVADAGVIAPLTAPTAGTAIAGGSVPDGAHTYKVTFLYYDTQESNGSPASGAQTATSPNSTIPLTTIPVGGLGVTARKIYRDNNDGIYTLVGTITNNTATTFNDTAALGTTPIPEDNNEPPIWGLVVQHRDRLWVAGVAATQSTLYYSDAGLPDVWPTNNFIQCNEKDTINGLVAFNDKVVVFGKASFGIILGSTSSDFQYIDVSPNIGCVDNRSIQIVTIRGVPKLQWLSQFGVYQWDGSNIQLISDKIENLLQFNIQQSQGSFNKNIQNNVEDFLAGTQTPGIDLLSNPGSIQTKGYMEANEPGTLVSNPTKQWDTEPEWENGSSLTNCATQNGSNTLKAILDFKPFISDTTLNNLQSVSPTQFNGFVRTATVANNTGEFHAGGGSNVRQIQGSTGSGFSMRTAQPINLVRGGTINTLQLTCGNQTTNTRLMIWADSSGVPGSVLYTGAFQAAGGLGQNSISASPNLAVSSGRVWIGQETSVNSADFASIYGRSDVFFTQANGMRPLQSTNGGGWTQFNVIGPVVAGLSLPIAFTFTQTELASVSGTMTSAVYDTFSTSPVNPFFLQVITALPAATRVVTVIQASNDPLMMSGVITSTADTAIDPNDFNDFVALSNKRYWRMITTVSTTDDRVTATVQKFSLDFGACTWVSEAIDHTADIVSLDSLLVVSTVPSGTSVTVTIATSADNITYSPFTSLGSATPARYSKVRAILTTDSLSTVTPLISSIALNWTITSTFTSSAISTILTPVQWGAFQTDFNLNGGTVLYEIRSATTEAGLMLESWTTVTNGQIIPVALNIWVQWRVTITSHVNQTPEVKSVVVNWLVVQSTGIRVASLFYNQVYYLAAAEFNSPTNNIVLYYDREGRWGQYTNLNINTMGLFYGQAYYGDSLVGNYIHWLDPTITSDQVINLSVLTKAYSDELKASDKTKALRHVILTCEDTLATITPSYSIDNGQSWLNMTDVITGQPSFTGSGTSRIMKIRFVPISETIKWGYDIIIRLTNADQYPVNISDMRAKAYISDRQVLTR